MKKQIITIAGKPGSGKSTTAKMVASLLNYTRYSSGDFMRQIAKDRQLTLEEINHLAETDPSIDEEVDQYVRAQRDKERVVIDSRLAFYWIPESFKVYLDLDLNIAAERIYGNKSEERFATEQHASDMEAYAKQIESRLESEKRRYQKYYNLNPYDLSHFDLVIDTAEHTPDSVASFVVDSYKSWIV